MEEAKSVYLIISQTGTLFSRVLKFFTHAEYNHSSISLDPSLEEMYSFGRLNPYNPFVGGFVKEGKNIGTFKRFYKTTALVLELKVSAEQYNGLKSLLEYMKQNNTNFSYNYWGVFCAIFKYNVSSQRKFYCSQFVRACLASFKISNSQQLPKVIKPIDFLQLKGLRQVYRGMLKDYQIVNRGGV